MLTKHEFYNLYKKLNNIRQPIDSFDCYTIFLLFKSNFIIRQAFELHDKRNKFYFPEVIASNNALAFFVQETCADAFS